MIPLLITVNYQVTLQWAFQLWTPRITINNSRRFLFLADVLIHISELPSSRVQYDVRYRVGVFCWFGSQRQREKYLKHGHGKAKIRFGSMAETETVF